MREVTERRITYQYGPDHTYEGVFSGDYSWETLEGFIKEDRWGSPYVVIGRQERTVVYGDWKDVQ